MTIQGVTCYVPPPGFVFDRNPEVRKQVEVGIYSRSDIPAEQYWEIPPEPKDWKKKRREEKKKQKTNPSYSDPELTAYVNQEWFRRMNGFWFMNNGVPTYLDGRHYFYLAHWSLDVGPPKFYHSDKLYYYFLASAFEDPRCLGIINFANRRSGKCFAPGTKIRMYDGGLKSVENIAVGELVMGPDSMPRTVGSLASGQEEMYEVIPNKGNPFTVNGSHILTMLWNGNGDCDKHGWKKNEMVNISVVEYIGLTWEKSHLVMRRSGWGDGFKENKHFIPPYLFGAWLGDGTACNGGITSADKEIVDAFSVYASSIGLKFKQAGSNKYAYHLFSENNFKKTTVTTLDGDVHVFDSVLAAEAVFGGRDNVRNKRRGIASVDKEVDGQVNQFRAELRSLCVINNKHIPLGYMIDSEHNRLELLAGILDTDGHLCLSNGSARGYEITQKNELLSGQIAELARSLGFYASINKKVAVLKRPGKDDYRCDVFRVAIYGNLGRIPCRLPRKKAPLHDGRVNPMRTGFKVVPLGIGPYFGFSVDKDNLFLLEDGMVVHNSYKAGAVLYEGLSRMRSSFGGIQSKNKTDAGAFFQKCVTLPLTKLKDFFIPEYDKQLGLDSKSKIRFFRKSKGGDEDSVADDEVQPLESEIDFRESGQKAYDNMKLKICVEDEFGKLDPEHSLIERHRTVRWCMMDAGDIIGKFVYCTTVEDMGSGENIRESKQMFDESDPSYRPVNGQTVSGLYRFRLPAYETYRYDRYGMPMIEQSRAELQAAFDVLLNEGDYVGYASLKRKQPFTDADIFRVAAKAPVWDIIKISDQLSALAWQEPGTLRVRGNFVWEGGERDTRVKFVKMASGRFLIHPEVLEMLSKEEQNLLRPKNKHRFVAGCDPFEQKFAETPSNGAAYTYMKFDPAHPDLSNWLVVEYCARPQPNVFFQDMLKMCVFFGMEILVENNKIGLINYMEGNGYGHFLFRYPATKTAGIYASEQSKELASEAASEYITNHCHCIPFPDLLEDAAMFDLSESTKFDRSMAFMWTILAVGNPGIVKKKEGAPIEAKSIIKRHKIRRG